MIQKLFSKLLFLCLISYVLAESCITCNSSTNADCLSNTSQFTADTCPGDCYTAIDTTSGIVTRGCFNSTIVCNAQNCQKCSTADCNKEQSICQTCNSATNPTCVQLGPSNAFNSVCETPSAQCYVALNETATVRRCAAIADTNMCADASGNCKVCTGANCNSAIYPETRLKCYQCQGNGTNNCDDPTIAGSNLQPIVCTNYVVNDQCYSTGTSVTNVQRGCKSDTSNTLCASGTTNALCKTCNTDGCNTAIPVNFTCIECRSDNDANCLNNVSDYGGVECTIQANTTETPKCYQSWYNNLFIRGCLTDALARIQLLCANENGSCKTCTTSNCNFQSASGAVVNTLATGILLLTTFLALSQY